MTRSYSNAIYTNQNAWNKYSHRIIGIKYDNESNIGYPNRDYPNTWIRKNFISNNSNNSNKKHGKNLFPKMGQTYSCITCMQLNYPRHNLPGYQHYCDFYEKYVPVSKKTMKYMIIRREMNNIDFLYL
jgi:hypothetical protein